MAFSLYEIHTLLPVSLPDLIECLETWTCSVHIVDDVNHG